MGKVIDVDLRAIFCDFTGSADQLEISGKLYGITFNDPPFVEKSRRDIFLFPDGPITIVQGQLVEINKIVAFMLSTPSTEPATLNGRFLRFGGELFESGTSWGESFSTISTDNITQPDLPLTRRVRFSRFDREVRVDFVLTLASFV